MWRTRTLFSVLVGMLVLTSAPTAAADDDSRPFAVVLEGNANPMPTEDPCTLLNTETAVGRALDIGRITWESRELVYVCSDPAEVEGEFVITAANGDRIVGVYETRARLDFTTNEVTAFGFFKITGGSGRFEGARGGGVITAEGSLLPPFEVTGNLFGRISY